MFPLSHPSHKPSGKGFEGSRLHHHPYCHTRERKEGQWQACDGDRHNSISGWALHSNRLTITEMEMDLHRDQNTDSITDYREEMLGAEGEACPGEKTDARQTGKQSSESRETWRGEEGGRQGERQRGRETEKDTETKIQKERQRNREIEKKRERQRSRQETEFPSLYDFSLDAQRLDLEFLGRNGPCQERMKGQRGDPNGHPD